MKTSLTHTKPTRPPVRLGRRPWRICCVVVQRVASLGILWRCLIPKLYNYLTIIIVRKNDLSWKFMIRHEKYGWFSGHVCGIRHIVCMRVQVLYPHGMPHDLQAPATTLLTHTTNSFFNGCPYATVALRSLNQPLRVA